MDTKCMATSFYRNQVYNLLYYLQEYNIMLVGIYSFKVELYELSAAVSVELWISENSDPVKMKKILTFVYDDTVVSTMYIYPVRILLF